MLLSQRLSQREFSAVSFTAVPLPPVTSTFGKSRFPLVSQDLSRLESDSGPLHRNSGSSFPEPTVANTSSAIVDRPHRLGEHSSLITPRVPASTSEWVAHQRVEAFPWDAPQYLLRDLGDSYRERVHQAADWLGIRKVLTAPQSPWRQVRTVQWHRGSKTVTLTSDDSTREGQELRKAPGPSIAPF